MCAGRRERIHSTLGLVLVAAGLFFRSIRADEKPDFSRWEKAIAALEKQDKDQPPPKNSIVFVGSSSIRLWDLKKSFPDPAVINHGFGGSQITDSVHFASRLVTKLAPRLVVLYAGDNDIGVGKSPEQVAAGFLSFAQTVHMELPNTRVLFISIKPSVLRWKLWEKMQKANSLIKAECKMDKRLTYVDITQAMLGDDGKPQKDFFRADGLHLNAKGYELWTRVLRPYLQSETFLGSKAGDQLDVAGVMVCWCPPGRFRMGSPPNEPERRPDEDQVEVTLTKGFWIGKFEVTQGQWKRVVGRLPGDLTAGGGRGDAMPVYNVNYAEAEEFCRKLTEIALASGDLPKEWQFRLPTEAQWEYACRAGTTTATSFGDKLSSKQANFQGKPYNEGEEGPSLKRATKVGSYPANPWGIHDMHGNVVEWCRDWYHSRLQGGNDPDLSSVIGSRTRDGTYSRSRRGSAWTDDGWASRSAFRQRFEPERRSDHIGFRIVAVIP
jgi:formylglycine-generating enzyme required for sulfatase activity